MLPSTPQLLNLRDFARQLILRDADRLSSLEVVIAPPALYLLLAREHLRQGIEVAAQNVFNKPNGAFTGEISAEQLKDSGIRWTLTGHSERRVIIGEENDVSVSGGLKLKER